MTTINSLFSSMNTADNSSSGSGDFLGISYTDYASIKNGSYRKLVSSYYEKELEESGVSSSSASKDSEQTLTSIQKAADNLKTSARTLLDKGSKSLFTTKTDEKGNSYTDYNTDAVYKAVKSFVDNYNETVDAVTESDTMSILRTARNMVSFTSANEKALSEVGITVGSDNKLSIDEDKFKSASKARVQSLFQSSGGYVYQISAKATSLKSYAATEAKKAGSTDKASSYKAGITSTSTSKDTSKTLGSIQEAADEASKSLEKLLKTGSSSVFEKVTKTDENGQKVTDYDKDAIYKSVKSFVKDYNKLVDETGDSDTSSIFQARKTMINQTKANKTALAAVGITIDSDNNLSINEEKFKNADMTKVKDLFQGVNSFGDKTKTQITKINTYAEKEAAKANTYSDTGSYSNNYTSGDWYNSYI